MSDPSVLSQVLHLSGRDEPGVLAELTALVEQSGARLREITHSSVAGCLVVALWIESAVDSTLPTLIGEFAKTRRLHVDTLPAEQRPRDVLPCGLCVTLLGSPSNVTPLARVTAQLATRGYNVESSRTLGQVQPRGVELNVIKAVGGRIPRDELFQLRAELFEIATQFGVDMAVQRDDFYRKSKRLLCMDVDSTFVKGEFIDELAELAGVKSAVAEITARAMRGELDFKEALRERVKLLRGLPMTRALELCDRFELSPGGEELVRTAQQLGLRVGLVSGGFDFFVGMLKTRFGLDFAFANQLEVVDGVLTGNVVGTIVDGERKAQVLRDMAQVFGVHVEQTIAIGDGANDIFMLEAAGLGVAYQAKPRLQAVADARFNHHDRLDTLFYLMGFDVPEVTSACR